jgi:hypothetical protein
MNKRVVYNPIFITGVERSGSTLIARILDMCGVWSGICNSMYENKNIIDFSKEFLQQYKYELPQIKDITIPMNWGNSIDGVIIAQGGFGKQWMVKHSTLTRLWPIWNYAYPDAKWLIVRRRTGDVIQSCLKTGYMQLFKNKQILNEFGFTTEEEGWLWWVHQYEERFVEMITAGLNCRIIWPERMVMGNYQQIYETIDWLGLHWNNKIPEVIDPLLNKSREKEGLLI